MYRFDRSWGSFAEVPATPSGIAVDRLGNVYATYASSGLIQKFTSAGKFIVDSYGNVFVTDIGNNLVEVFAPQ
jgi:hypothetical protein